MLSFKMKFADASSDPDPGCGRSKSEFNADAAHSLFRYSAKFKTRVRDKIKVI